MVRVGSLGRLSVVLLCSATAAFAAQGAPAPSAVASVPKDLGSVSADSTGPHRVGFRVVETVDPSRSFLLRPRPGRPGEVDRTPRPIQIGIWYPARPVSGASVLTYGDYNEQRFRRGGESVPPEVGRESGLREMRRELAFVRQTEITDALLDQYFATKGQAVRDAPPADGRFPLVLGEPGYFNSGLGELLASRGFVVVSVAFNGVRGTRASTDLEGVEAMARDFEVALGAMRTDPHVDSDHAGVVLFSLPVAPALVAQMRGRVFDAFVSIDGWDGLEQGVTLLRRHMAHDPQAVTVPYLRIVGTNDEFNPQRTRAFIDALKYADRTMVTFDKLGHRDFNDDVTPGGADRLAGRRAAFGFVVRFLEAHLKADPAALKWLAGSPREQGFAEGTYTVERVARLPLPPSEEEFEALLRQPGGVSKATAVFQAARERDPGVRVFREPAVNAVGYELLAAKRFDEAIAVFKLNAEAFPESGNVHDSLGEAYMAAGDRAKAIESYEKAVQRDPANANAARTLTKLKGEELRR